MPKPIEHYFQTALGELQARVLFLSHQVESLTEHRDVLQAQLDAKAEPKVETA